ncbi:helix-turn-helix domain-containing protein [Desulfogranum marinum]|uniref:helix-turn-helix domain-containing protein n=1 Tax=Desulfogranum marinum TaxID=453220 RepID=UPI0029C69AAE|nr:helix-turn-helix domain-containing protein [Desulfogranum marinum]
MSILTKHFWFDDRMIKDGTWASLSNGAKGVYVSIAVHCDEEGTAFPGEDTIAKLTGLSRKTVRKAINELAKAGLLRIERWKTKRGHSAKRYHVKKTPRDTGFPFSKDIVATGTWGEMGSCGQAVYISMRNYCYWDGYEESYDSLTDFKERTFEYCSAEIEYLLEDTGVTKSTYYRGIKSLLDVGMIQRGIDENGKKAYMVGLLPDQFY